MTRAVGAVVAHFPDTEGVTSSNLVSPTKVEAIRLDITEEPNIRAIGAAASALRSHRRGRRFDSYIAHPISRSSVYDGGHFLYLPCHGSLYGVRPRVAFGCERFPIMSGVRPSYNPAARGAVWAVIRVL